MSKPKKTIYIISECPYAGMLKAMIENAKLLVEQNHDVVFVFPEKSKDRYGEKLSKNSKNLSKLGKVEYISMSKQYSRIMKDSMLFREFLKKQNNKKVIVFSYGSYAGKIARVLYMVRQINILYHVPQCIDLERMSFRYRIMELWVEKMLSAHVTKYIACSPSEVHRLHSFFKIPIDKIFFCPNSVSHKKKKLKLYKRTHSFIYVGRIVKSKGLNEVISALRGLGLSYELLVLGDGFELENLRKKYPEVSFMGNVSNEDVVKYLKDSRFIINNSVVEGLSFSILEALALGTIPIASRVDGNDDVIIDSYNGFMFNDKSELIKILFKTKLLDDKQLDVMSQAAIETACRVRTLCVERFTNSINSLT